jgi:multidrug efflux pump subunit AcrA (membrane-fusion protein)
MDADSSDKGSAQYAGRIKTQTFKQFQLERLIKEGKVIPASKLAETREQELKRIKDFEAASEDEERHRRAAIPAPKDKLESLTLVRDRFEE